MRPRRRRSAHRRSSRGRTPAAQRCAGLPGGSGGLRAVQSNDTPCSWVSAAAVLQMPAALCTAEAHTCYRTATADGPSAVSAQGGDNASQCIQGAAQGLCCCCRNRRPNSDPARQLQLTPALQQQRPRRRQPRVRQERLRTRCWRARRPSRGSSGGCRLEGTPLRWGACASKRRRRLLPPPAAAGSQPHAQLLLQGRRRRWEAGTPAPRPPWSGLLSQRRRRPTATRRPMWQPQRPAPAATRPGTTAARRTHGASTSLWLGRLQGSFHRRVRRRSRAPRLPVQRRASAVLRMLSALPPASTF